MAEFGFSDLVPGYRDPAGRALLVTWSWIEISTCPFMMWEYLGQY